LKLAEYDMFHRGDWSDDGWLYWTARYPGGIVSIRDSGGETEAVTQLDVAAGERSHRFASLLPGATRCSTPWGSRGSTTTTMRASTPGHENRGDEDE
jgi:hypothetical protein